MYYVNNSDLKGKGIAWLFLLNYEQPNEILDRGIFYSMFTN